MTTLRDLYFRYRVCMVRIAVAEERENERKACGSGFHIGGGWVATARHVIDGKKIEEITQYGWPERPLEMKRVIVPDREHVDVALIETNFDTSYLDAPLKGVPDDEKVDHINLGTHLDDWLGEEFVMTQCLIMGYPRVAQAKSRGLVAAAGEVNAVIDKYSAPHPHFVVSPLARGGFSGGPVISEFGFVLGIYTESLIEDRGVALSDGSGKSLDAGPSPLDPGFAAALSVEPLWDLLVKNDITPGANAEFVSALLQSHRTGEEIKALVEEYGEVSIELVRLPSGASAIALRGAGEE